MFPLHISSSFCLYITTLRMVVYNIWSWCYPVNMQCDCSVCISLSIFVQLCSYYVSLTLSSFTLSMDFLIHTIGELMFVAFFSYVLLWLFVHVSVSCVYQTAFFDDLVIVAMCSWCAGTDSSSSLCVVVKFVMKCSYLSCWYLGDYNEKRNNIL